MSTGSSSTTEPKWGGKYGDTVPTTECRPSGHPWDKVIRAVASEQKLSISAAAEKLIADREYSEAERAAIRATVMVMGRQQR